MFSLNYLFIIILVIPHITDAIQEWVERVAKQPVSDDGIEPDVRLLKVYTVNTSGSFFLRIFGLN